MEGASLKFSREMLFSWLSLTTSRQNLFNFNSSLIKTKPSFILPFRKRENIKVPSLREGIRDGLNILPKS